MTAKDRRFVVPTWALSSSYYGLPKEDRFKLVDRLIDDGAQVIVLANGSTVHAWASGDLTLLHYVYVPPELRGHGFAKQAITALLGAYDERIYTTHPWPRKSSRFRFEPRLLFGKAA